MSAANRIAAARGLLDGFGRAQEAARPPDWYVCAKGLAGALKSMTDLAETQTAQLATARALNKEMAAIFVEIVDTAQKEAA